MKFSLVNRFVTFLLDVIWPVCTRRNSLMHICILIQSILLLWTYTNTRYPKRKLNAWLQINWPLKTKIYVQSRTEEKNRDNLEYTCACLELHSGCFEWFCTKNGRPFGIKISKTCISFFGFCKQDMLQLREY